MPTGSLRSIRICMSQPGSFGDPRPPEKRIKRAATTHVLKVGADESVWLEPPDKDISPWSTLMEDISEGRFAKCPHRSPSQQNRLAALQCAVSRVMEPEWNWLFHTGSGFDYILVWLLQYESVRECKNTIGEDYLFIEVILALLILFIAYNQAF